MVLRPWEHWQELVGSGRIQAISPSASALIASLAVAVYFPSLLLLLDKPTVVQIFTWATLQLRR